jgi:nitroimidazol reductase NimA-like FMN-containing flavoprotein (pyridoxamine 5'-phosphate oxidase superfamily)
MKYDEPMYINVEKGAPEAGESIEADIRNLCEDESFAVLATQGAGEPYTSLIGFAASRDLKYLVFATPRQTRKFTLLEENRNVSLLIDNRAQQLKSLNQISALTVTGKVILPSDSEEIEKWRELLTRKHPYLDGFIRSETTALVVVEVSRFYYVRRFQEVFQWTP